MSPVLHLTRETITAEWKSGGTYTNITNKLNNTHSITCKRLPPDKKASMCKPSGPAHLPILSDKTGVAKIYSGGAHFFLKKLTTFLVIVLNTLEKLLINHYHPPKQPAQQKFPQKFNSLLCLWGALIMYPYKLRPWNFSPLWRGAPAPSAPLATPA